MEEKTLSIKVKADKSDSSKTALSLRYIISDTIEERGLGEVIEENIGLDENDVEVVAIVKPDLETLEEIRSMLDALGLRGQYDLSYED